MFAIPLACSSILQQLFNSADVAVVGRFAGDKALAAVGSCVALVGIFVNLNVGLSVGPNAVLANLIGQQQRKRINGMVHTILTFGVLTGIVLMFTGMAVARLVLEASGTPASVIDEALLYIRIYFISIPFMVIYNFGSCYTKKLWGQQTAYVLSSGIRNGKCDSEPDLCNLFLHGSRRRCNRNSYFKYTQCSTGTYPFI